MTATTVLEVPDMSCGHCKETIEAALRSVDGVESAVVDLEAKSVTVTGSAGTHALERAIEEAGYNVAGVA